MSELIHHFGIDWKLLLAQAINFFILFFLLKKFAYGPILKVLRDRKREIDKGLEFTKEAEERLLNVEKEQEKILIAARGEALNIVSTAEESGKRRKDEIVAGASKKSEEIVADAKRLIKEEKAKMEESIYGEARDLIRLGIARVLGKMPQEERDSALINAALEELRAIKSAR